MNSSINNNKENNNDLSLGNMKSSGASNVQYLLNSSLKGFSTKIHQADCLGDTLNLNQMRKVLSEKDKQLGYLERKLIAAESEIKNLQENEHKIKHSERNAKVLLSAKQTAAKRTSIALMQASETISKLTARELNRERRSKLRKDELEKELDVMEDQLDTIKEISEKKIKDLLISHDIELTGLRDGFDMTCKEFKSQIFSLKHDHGVELDTIRSTMSTLNVKAAEEGMDSNHLRDELTECIATNATLSQQICQLQFREEEQNNKLRMMMADLSAKEKEYQSQIFELLNKRADVQENCQFTLQVKVNENLLLKSHLDECLDNKRALEYDLALLQVKCDDASSSVWQLQDQLESEMEAAVCKEQELASTLNVLKLENIALQSELKGARQVTASLEDALASAVATRELKALDTTHDRPTHDVITCLQLKFDEQDKELKTTRDSLSELQRNHDDLLAISDAQAQALEVQQASEAALHREMDELKSRFNAAVVASREYTLIPGLTQVGELNQESELHTSEHHLVTESGNSACIQDEAHVGSDIKTSILEEKELCEGDVSLDDGHDEELEVDISGLREKLRLKTSEVHELYMKLSMLTDAFEQTRCVKEQSSLSAADQKTVKDLQQLLGRSDSELIKRASKNASLQYEVNRLTSIIQSNSDLGNEEHTAEVDMLQRALAIATSKMEKISLLNVDLTAKLLSYHEITNTLQEEMSAAHQVHYAEAEQHVIALETTLLRTEAEVKRLKVINLLQEGIINDQSAEEYDAVSERLCKLNADMEKWQGQFEAYQSSLSIDDTQSLTHLRCQVSALMDEKNLCKKELIILKSEYGRLSADYECLLSSITGGLSSNKQKIQYVSSLKEQINVLVADNVKLRSRE